VAELTERSAATAVRYGAAPYVPLIRVVSDLALIVLGFALAYYVRYIRGLGGEVGRTDFRPLGAFAPVIVLLSAILLAIFALRGLYRLPRWTGFLDEAALVIGGALTGFGALVVLVFYSQHFYFSRLIFLYALVFVVALLIAKRVAIRGTQAWLRARGRWVDRVLVVGAGPAAQRIMGALIGQPRLGYEVVGFVEDAPLPPDWVVVTQTRVVRPDHLGACRDLNEVIRRYAVDEVIIALQQTEHEHILWTVEQCRARRIAFTLVPDLFELSLDRVEINALNGLPLISVQDAGIRGWNYVLKRAFDIAFAVSALTLGAIPFALIALLIKLDTPGPVILKQTRVGRGGRHFTCYKFRSMFRDADKMQAQLAQSAEYSGDRVMFKLRDDPRRTRVGRWLRRMSLDELPQFINILKGDMSVVGPRPAVPPEVAMYEPWHLQRLEVPPGLTGLWQVNGRSDLTFDEMVRLDLFYAEHWSLGLDLRIILRTIPAVLTARGAY
jgi:exopolysaccharide biosynthesis polyprenyl glycosylphosphotransferase